MNFFSQNFNRTNLQNEIELTQTQLLKKYVIPFCI